MTENINKTKKSNKLNQTKKIFFSGLLFYFTLTSCNTSCEKDYSLKPQEYKKLGMPDNKKVWTSDDYTGANITLSTLKINSPLSLPKNNSKKSGELFKRIVNEENLDFIYDTTVALKIRAYLIQHYPLMVEEVEQMYTIEYKGKLYYREEILLLKGFKLLVYDKMLELAVMIERSDDESLSGFKDGMQNVKNYYLNYISYLLSEMGKTEFSFTDNLKSLSKEVSESVIRNSGWMTQSDKNKLLNELNNAIEIIGLSEIRNNMKNAFDVLKK